MIQLRWYKTVNYPEPKLQYRQMYNTTVYAGMPTEMQKLETVKFEWSEWIDVPMVFEEFSYERTNSRIAYRGT